MQYPRGKNARPVSSAGCYPPDTRRPLVKAVASPKPKRPIMTTAIALTGQWEGLRAFPTGFRTRDCRERMEAALERLQQHRERLLRHARRIDAALARIDGVSFTVIARLDEADGDPDSEDGADDEPSLSFPSAVDQDTAIRLEPLGCPAWVDLEAACEDEGGEHDGREPEGFS